MEPFDLRHRNDGRRADTEQIAVTHFDVLIIGAGPSGIGSVDRGVTEGQTRQLCAGGDYFGLAAANTT